MPFAIVVVFPVLMEIVFIRPEEVMLKQQFGESWLAYQQQVRRWF